MINRKLIRWWLSKRYEPGESAADLAMKAVRNFGLTDEEPREAREVADEVIRELK